MAKAEHEVAPERRGARRWAPCLALAVLTVAVFEAGLLRGETYFGGDLLTYFAPRYARLGELLGRGELPRWNPLEDHGAPWFGPRAAGPLYPSNLLFLGPLRLGLACLLALHALLAAEGARRVAAQLADPPGSRRAAFLAGAAYGAGGFLLSLNRNPLFLISGAWLPWALLGGLLAAQRQRRGPGLAGAAVALCFLAGDPQGALIAAGLALAGAASASGRAALGPAAEGSCSAWPPRACR